MPKSTKSSKKRNRDTESSSSSSSSSTAPRPTKSQKTQQNNESKQKVKDNVHKVTVFQLDSGVQYQEIKVGKGPQVLTNTPI